MDADVIDRTVLSQVLQRELQDPHAEPLDSSLARLRSGAGQGLGVYRLFGHAHACGKRVPWSVILKIVPAAGQGPVHAWGHADREVLAYRSGILRNLPGRLAAPRCLALTRHDAGARCLWLEDLGRHEVRWSLATYARAAQCLGRFNGAYLAGAPIPKHPWLSRHWLRQWLAEGAAAMATLPEHLDHPLVRRVYPPDVAARITGLWNERDGLLRALDMLPQTLCHHDAFRRNLVATGDRIAALDWAFMGSGPVGAELSPLVTATLAFGEMPLESRPALERATTESYIAGVRESGWQGSDEQITFGYRATSALRYGPGTVRLVLPSLLDPALRHDVTAVVGMPFDRVLELWAGIIRDTVARDESPLMEPARSVTNPTRVERPRHHEAKASASVTGRLDYGVHW
jgi:hypothetical protein